MWRTLILGLGALVVAVTTGTAVMTAIDDQDDPPAVRQATDEQAGDGAVVSAVCAEGHPDCEDMIVNDGGAAGSCPVGTPDCVDADLEQCATEEPCGDFDARCAADTECVEPGFLAEEPVCPAEMTYEECFPDGTPAGWDCVQLESFPVQIKCYPIECQPIDGPVTILPAPDEPVIVDDLDVIEEPINPELVDPGVAVGEPAPSTPIECVAPVDCSTDPSVVHCLPTECGPNETCIAPDCAVSSDGSVFCPDTPPVPCDEVQGVDGGCSSPGSCGDLGCSGEGYVCPDGITDEECAKMIEEQRQNSGGGSNGSGGATEAVE